MGRTKNDIEKDVIPKTIPSEAQEAEDSEEVSDFKTLFTKLIKQLGQ